MRTGRTRENTGLNVRARQRSNESGSRMRRGPAPPVASPSYSQTRPQRGNGQYNYARSTSLGRPPVRTSAIHCSECGSMFNNATSRYCAQCGFRR
jgi:hypothetical protein